MRCFQSDIAVMRALLTTSRRGHCRAVVRGNSRAVVAGILVQGNGRKPVVGGSAVRVVVVGLSPWLSPAPGRRETALLGCRGDAGADRIQIDLGQAGQGGRFIAELDRPKTASPEPAVLFVLGVGHPGDRLRDHLHDPDGDTHLGLAFDWMCRSSVPLTPLTSPAAQEAEAVRAVYRYARDCVPRKRAAVRIQHGEPFAGNNAWVRAIIGMKTEDASIDNPITRRT